MDLQIIAWILAAVAAAIALFFYTQTSSVRNDLKEAQKAKGELDTRLESTRSEVAKSKEDLRKKSKALEELKAESKKKARREGKKEKDNNKDSALAETVDESAEIKRYKKMVSALEVQVKTLKSDSKKETAEVENEIRSEFSKKLDAAKEKAESATKTLNELRASIKRKAEERPDVPGSELNLAEVPAPVVQELSRYYRKGDEFERLYNMSQGKIQLANDRFQELQKKYFAVCRELAVVAGTENKGDDKDVAQKVEGLVGSVDAKAESQAGEAQKKRRRRRRKKRPEGEKAASENEGASNEGASNEGEAKPDTSNESVSEAPQAELFASEGANEKNEESASESNA